MFRSLPSAEQFGRVALVKGGWAAERDVSLVSGAACEAALQRAGIDLTIIDVRSPADLDVLHSDHFDRVFNIIHGRGGEDGQLQALLELKGIPCTGSGVLGSALAMDKLRSKYLWAGAGMPTPAYRKLTSPEDCEEAARTMTLPLMVKPSLEGSSIGMSKVHRGEDLSAALDLAARYGEVFVEQWVEGAEYTVSILDGQALPLIRLETDQDFYDYAAKYERDDTRYHCPCGLEGDEESRLKNLAMEAFEAVGAGGWGRVDLMVDRDGQPWLIEVNTVPGMTGHSLVPMAARQAGIDFDELALRILMTAGEVC